MFSFQKDHGKLGLPLLTSGNDLEEQTAGLRREILNCRLLC